MQTKYDWTNVPEDVVAIATDADGWGWEYLVVPTIGQNTWDTDNIKHVLDPHANPFRGDWRDSLELRPTPAKTRREALKHGFTTYTTGKPCHHGNVAERSVDTYKCLCSDCKKERSQRVIESQRKAKEQFDDEFTTSSALANMAVIFLIAGLILFAGLWWIYH